MTNERRLSELPSDSDRQHDDTYRYGKAFQVKIQQKLVTLLIPNSKFRLGFEAFIFMAIWYNSVMTPIRLFILDIDTTPQALIFADIALDFIFVIDTILHLYRPYIDKDTGRMVTNTNQIRSHYLASGTFYFNLIACIPILKGPLSPLLDEKTNLVLSTNFNILRMIRILHFPSQFKDLKMYLSQNGPVNDSVFRMGIILFFTQLFMCILGSVYFGSAAAVVEDVCPDTEDFTEDFIGAEMWIAEDSVITGVMNPDTCPNNMDNNQCDECPQQLFFIRSVYFLMQTLFTIGYGDSVVPSRSITELILVCFFMLFGVFGFGLIIANMTSVLSNIDVVSMRFRHEMDNVNKWLALRSVPEPLREMVEQHFSYLVRTQHGMLDDALFADLPPQLKKEFNDLSTNLLIKIPFFNPQYRTKQFLSQITEVLIRRIYAPGSFILYEGEKQREMTIIKTGRVNLYVRESLESVGTLVVGDCLGDYQLLFGTVNQVGAKALEFVEVLALTFPCFEEVMDRQNEIEFRSLGCNFRQSKDPGALETIETSKKFLDTIAKNVKNLSNKAKSKKLQNMLEEELAETKNFCILPSSSIHVYWDIFSLLFIIYYSVSSPIRFAFFFRNKTLEKTHDGSFFIDYIIDIIFVFDLLLRLQVYAYIDFNNGRNEVVVDRVMIRKNYMNSNWFKIDRIAIIPFDILSLIFGHHTLLRIPKLARVFQISSTVNRLQRNFDDCMDISMTESQSSGLIMLIYSVLIVVWSSAGWNAIRREERIYESVYWALTTLTTVGYGDFTPSDFRETCYAVVIGAIGATFTAAIIANVTSFFHDVDISEDNIDHKLNCVKCFMENHACTFEQTKNIQEYFDYTEREQDGLNEEILLRKSVPDHIRNNLLIHVTQSMVINCNLFTNCESGFLRQIMTALEQRFFGSRNMVLTESMPADGMYFIKKGIVELVAKTSTADLKTLKRLEADDNFAEECLFEHWDQNPYLAIATSDCELWFLSRSKFNRLVDDFPRVRALLSTVSRHKNVGTRRRSIQYITKAVERAKRTKTHFIHPDNFFIQCWFGIVLIVILYNILALPFRIAFMENHEITPTWLLLDYFGDTILLVDVIIRASFLGYYDDNHLMVKRGEIWKHYVKSGKMKWHLLSLLPFETALLITNVLCPLWKLQVWSLFRMNKNFRSLEMGYLIHRVEASLAKAGVRVPKNAIRVGKLVMVILLSAHLVGCIFFMIANYNHHSSTSATPINWANDEGLMDHVPSCPGTPLSKDRIIDRYVAALYWAMATLTTVGYGDITAHQDSVFEISFATVILIVGTAIYTMVIALLEDIVSQLDVTSSLHKMRMDKINTYVQSQGLPDILKTKIDAYYENLWKTQRGVKGQELLKFFPRSFRAEMTLGMLSSLLYQTFFIKDCTADFVAHILDFISFEVYLPDDTVFHEGERCNSLLFLYKGEIDLLTSKNVKFKTVSNCVIGEASFFSREPQICNAKAKDQCEIYILQMEDFVTCLHDNQLMQKYVQYLLKNECQLQDKKRSISKMIKNLKSSKMEKMLVNNQESLIPKGIILPDALSRELWDAFALMLTVVFTFIIPYQISFTDTSISTSRLIIDLFMDIFFMIDVYARMRRFAVMKDGYVLTDPRQFRKIYLNSDFRGDLLSIIPLSTIGYVMNIKDARYGMLRLLQLTRVCRFGKYFDSFVETCNSRAKIAISTAVIRILQIFFIVLFLCHWVACAYHFIGDSVNPVSWLIADGSIGETMAMRYLRSFYWSLYTVTTIGYGSIPVVTNWERVFAMFVMATGAVICDAGITAILTSIISIRDQQAGANSRRIQCCKRFMKTYMVDQDLQDRVLSFYNYTDVELVNMNETEILSDLSVNLRSEVLHFFCFESLRDSCLLKDFSNGAVRSLVYLMKPYLAVPGENLSVIDEPCDSIFILRSGMMSAIDSSGYEALMPLGSIIGHIATAATTTEYSLPQEVLHIVLISAQGLKGKIGNPYLIFKVGSHSCRSTVKKTRNWNEEIFLKLPPNEVRCLDIIVKSWQNGQIHSTIGSISLSFDENTTGIQSVRIKDTQGRNVGVLKFRLLFRDLTPSESLSSDKLTTKANGYCHLYSVKSCQFEQLIQYMDASKKESLEDRLSGPFIEFQHQVQLNYKERIQNCWRRPSRPSVHVPSVPEAKKSLLIDRKAVQRLSIPNGNKDHSQKTVNGAENNNDNHKMTREKSYRLFPRQSKKFSSVYPDTNDGDNDDVEAGLSSNEEEQQNGISSTNKVETGTLLSQGMSEKDISENNLSQFVDELSENDKNWDVLVDVHDESLSLNKKSRPSRRSTFFVEWTTLNKSNELG